MQSVAFQRTQHFSMTLTFDLTHHLNKSGQKTMKFAGGNQISMATVIKCESKVRLIYRQR